MWALRARWSYTGDSNKTEQEATTRMPRSLAQPPEYVLDRVLDRNRAP
jgi:hypothetical protein